MKKFATAIIILGLILSIFSGCALQQKESPNNQITENINLYYGDANNEKFVTEEQEITYDSTNEDKYKVALEELIKGPTNSSYQANINKNTKVNGITKQGNDLTVDLSSEFNQFGGSIAEVIAVGSVVNTLTQFDEVKRVKILIDGNEFVGPSGQPRGFMERFENNDQEKRTITLYFGNSDGTGVIAETREIIYNDDNNTANLIKAVLEELIKGPNNSKLVKTIPKEVKVDSVRIDNHIAFIDFSEEMHTKHWHGATGEMMTIASIANTLTEFEYIHKVKMTVAGEPMNIEHAILEEPVGRNENLIIKN